jgi:uncharacterized protein (TIGR02145 family)
MKTRNYIIAAAALTVLAACSSDENLVEPIRESMPVTLTCSTLTAIETRAAQDLNQGTFASGEIVKVRISNTGADMWTSYDFTTGNAGTMSPAGSVPYYPAGSQNIDIVAYYPATAGASFSVQTDQTSDADYKASDLTFASVCNQAKQAGAVNLAFTHKLAKLNVNVTAGTGVGSIIGVRILNIKPTVSFHQVTGTVGNAGGDATSIAMSSNGAAVIPAQTVSGEFLSIITDKGTATYTVVSKEFAAGQQYTLNITVGRNNIDRKNAINGWRSEGTVTVDSERPNIAGHEYVDMGTVIINGKEKNLKWATVNLGAYNLWDYGDYYSWAALTPQTKYDWANYPHMHIMNHGWEYITKYTFDDGQYDGSWYGWNNMFGGDCITRLEYWGYIHDAARQRWGGTWHIPTDEEWAALRDFTNFNWIWIPDFLDTGRDVMMIVRMNGPCEGNYIFLPTAGLRCDTSLYYEESNGYYWSSCLSNTRTNYARFLLFNAEGSGIGDAGRYYGFSIRPVSD